MHVEKKRIFVGNLPPHVNENDIQELFSQYVKVVSIDIKQRKVNTDENISSIFAFVNVETDNGTLQKCFQELSDYSWQGYYINLQLAKESFLERLKREREEAQAKNEQNSSKTTPIQNEEQNGKVTPAKTVSKKVESSSSSNDSSSDSEDSGNEKVKPIENNKMNLKLTKKKDISSSSSSSDDSSSSEEEKSKIKPVAEDDDNEFKLIIKSNKHKVKENGGLKIESFNSTPIHIISKNSDKTVKKDQKSLEADEKRKQSLLQMKNSYNQQKNLIKNALSRIDTKQNKIVFDDEEQSNKRKYNNDNHDHPSKKQRVPLFDDEGENEDNYNFEVKSQFEGKKGQKLLALQSRFTNDKRFALDERFADDEAEETNETGEVDDNEKEKQLDILESVLGHKVRKEKKDDEKRVNNTKGMLRFDPSKPEHSRYEIKRDENEKKTKKKEKEKEPEKMEEVPVIPEVSKEKFYQVKDNLKESLKEKEGFSLLSMFGRAEQENVTEENEPEAEELKKTKYGFNKNPFKYDSSDSEDEHKKQKEKPPKKENVVESRPSFRWTESFFFQAEDSRFNDGVDFLKKIQNTENPTSFKEKRHELGRILHNKSKNVEQDQRRLQRKLRKRIKVKKAKKS